MERAQRDRERKIKGKRRYDSEPSSDGLDDIMDDDLSEDDESIMNDDVSSCSVTYSCRSHVGIAQLFARIMESMNRSDAHAYRVSYMHDVGSSFDPDLDDPLEWEDELSGVYTRFYFA